MYQLDAYEIQELLTQATSELGGSARGGEQEYKKETEDPNLSTRGRRTQDVENVWYGGHVRQ